MDFVTVLKFKVVSDTEWLVELAKLCRRGRNAGAINWLLRKHGLPESVNQSTRKIKQSRKGKELSGEKSESTKIYHAVRDGAPGLPGDICSTISSEIAKHLAAKVDWRRRGKDGKLRRRADEIMDYEARSPFFTQLQVPVRSNTSSLRLTDKFVLVAFGRDVELSLRKVTAGMKSLVQRVIAGDLKYCDGKILERHGEWFFHLVIVEERDSLASDRSATLAPISGDESLQRDNFFRLSFPDGGSWHIGDGRYYLHAHRRLIGLRKQIGWLYRSRNGAGHGRKKYDAAVSRRNQQLANIRNEVMRRAIADTVRQCQRRNCGAITYRDPTGPAKDACWFARRGVDWNWTRFVADLKTRALDQVLRSQSSGFDERRWHERTSDPMCGVRHRRGAVVAEVHEPREVRREAAVRAVP